MWGSYRNVFELMGSQSGWVRVLDVRSEPRTFLLGEGGKGAHSYCCGARQLLESGISYAFVLISSVRHYSYNMA